MVLTALYPFIIELGFNQPIFKGNKIKTKGCDSYIIHLVETQLLSISARHDDNRYNAFITCIERMTYGTHMVVTRAEVK